MANSDRPRGATPVRYLGGAPYNGAGNLYAVDAANATAIFPGDFIVREADGNVAPYTGTGGGVLLGVCMGAGVDKQTFSNLDDLSQRYLAASTAGFVLVADDPSIVFEIQEDDAGTALTSAAGGANCDVLATAGSTTTGQSAHEIDRSTVAATIAQLRLLRLVDREDNEYGDSATWEVLINEHAYTTTAGV